jgi:ankyrin repeat protein
MALDNAGNTPLHLLLVGLATHALDASCIIDELLAPNPTFIASICNREGSTALHMACMAPETMVHRKSLQKILDANPSCAAKVNNVNQTPLNLHCRRQNATREVARMLLEAHPDAIHILDGERGWAPLHYACEQNNHDLIRLLLEFDRESASLRTNPGLETPLHRLCQKNVGERHIPSIQALMQVEPRMSIMRDAVKNYTPLHLLCKIAGIPCTVVRSLVDCMPEAASIPDNNHYLPIHHACEVGAYPDVIACLLKAHPASATALSKKNDSALSLACACNKSTQTVALLIKANPMALKEKNDYGFVPLHNCCGAVNPMLRIVQEILAVCPESVAMRSHGGETPLHVACGNPGCFVGVIELLTTQYEKNSDMSAEDALKESPQMTNKVGSTPRKYLFRGL